MRFALMLLLAGCATQPTYYWFKPGATQEEGNREIAQCEQAAYSLHPLASTEQGLRVYAACMQGKGWSLRER